MKFYSQADFDQSNREKKKAWAWALLFALPFLVMAVAGFVVRIELLCTLGVICTCSVLIFLYDLRLKPVMRYSRHLREIHDGANHRTLGALVRIGCDPVFMEGINFYEVILNIYEDLSEEGERRFLLDSRKEMPQEWLDSDVIVTSHGNILLAAELAPGCKA